MPAVLHRLPVIIGLCAPLVLSAPDTGIGQTADAPMPVRPVEAETLADLRWQARPVVILGDDAQVRDQIDRLQASAAALRERDVALLVDGPGAAALPSAGSSGFIVMLIGKDGGIKLRRDTVVDPADITGLIDTMPMRRNEAAKND